ncbi:MAG: amidohydrolase family protein [Vicinamibacterales bacterium]|nr:amidohydrolase family protein [Vicinamibacterales bacterium]
MTLIVDRREFLSGLAAVAAAGTSDAHAQSQPAPIPIIDTHIHLFDPTRPQGAPYSGPRGGGPPIPSLPPRYRKLAEPLGIVGAIKVEASPWLEDNLWVLEVAQTDTIIVGVIGNLEPDKPEFSEYLERYHKNPLFLGIRYGNLWGRDFTKQAENPAFINGLKLLAQAGLTLDTANPTVALLESIIRITDQVPSLRVVLDHVPSLDPTEAERARYEKVLAEIGKRPQIYVKLSAIVHRINDQVSLNVNTYRDRLDYLIGVFGDDRVIFGSDFPNSDGVAPVDRIVGVAKQYFATKPHALQEKYFWRNSIPAYHWVKREPRQPSL